MKKNYFGEKARRAKSSERGEAMPAAIVTAIVSSLILLGIASVVSLVVQNKADSEGDVALTTAVSNIDVSLRSDINQASYITAAAKLKQPATRLLGPTDVNLSGVNMHIPVSSGECKVIRWNINGNNASRDLTIYQSSLKDDVSVKCNETSPVVGQRTKVFAQNVKVDAPFRFNNQVGRELAFTVDTASLDKVNAELEKQLTAKGVQKLSDADFNELNKLMENDSYKAGFKNTTACVMDAARVWVDANNDGVKQTTEMVCPPAEADTVAAAWNSMKVAKVGVAFQMASNSGEVAKRDIAQNSSVPLYANATEAEAAVAGSSADDRPVAETVALSTATVTLGANYTINWTTQGVCPPSMVRSYKIYENNVLIRTQATQGYTKNYTNSATEFLNYNVQTECVRGALVVSSDMSAVATAKVIPAVPALVINTQPAATNAALNSNLTSTATCLYGTNPRYNLVQAVTSYGTPNTTLSNLTSVNRAINNGFTVVEGARYQYRVEAWCISPFDKSANTSTTTNTFTTLINTPATPAITAPLAGATNVATNATVTWNAVVCATGTTVKYYSAKDVNAGAAITAQVIDNWTTDRSLVSNNTQGNTVGYSVQARCEGTATGVNSAASPPSAVQYTTLINIPTVGAPMFTSPAEGATNVATNATVSWSVAVCAPSTTVQYYTTKNMNAGAAITAQVIDNWTAGNTLASSNTQGSRVGYTVAARCVGPNATSGVSATDTLTYTTAISAPATPTFTSPAEGATNVATNATVSWGVSTCATGTTVQYYTTKNMDAGVAITPVVIDNWTAGNTLATSNTQGNRVGYTVAARCVGPNATSGSSATDTLTYRTVINAPAAPSFTRPLDGETNHAVNVTVSWSVAVCGASTTVQYYTTKNMDNGVAITPIVIDNWTAGNTLATANTEGNKVGYTVQARCVGPNATSASSPVESMTYTTRVTAPAMPTFTAPADAATWITTSTTLTWNAVTCGTGMTPEYYLTKNMNAGVIDTTPTVMEDWTAAITSRAVSNTQGNKVGYTLQARCAGPNAVSPSSATDAITYTTRILAPAAPTFTAPAEGATNVATNATVTWSAVTCPTATTVKYYTTKNMDAGVIDTTPTVIDNWTAGNSLVSNNGQGNRVGYTVAARCDGPNADSAATATDTLTYTTEIDAPNAVAFIAPTPAANATRVPTNATIAWNSVTCGTGATAKYYSFKDMVNGGVIGNVVIDSWTTDLSYVTNNSASQGSTVRYNVAARCEGPNVNSAATPTVSRQYTTDVDAPGGAWAWHNNYSTVLWNAPSVGCAGGATIQYRVVQTKADNNALNAYGAWTTGNQNVLPTYNTGGYPQWAEVQSKCVGPNAESGISTGNTAKWVKHFVVSFSASQQWRRINVWASCPYATSVNDFHLYVAADGWWGARGTAGGIQTDEGAWIASAAAGGGGNSGWIWMPQTVNTQWNAAARGGTTHNWGYWGNAGWGSDYSTGIWGASMSGTYWNASGWGNWAYWWAGSCSSPYMKVSAKDGYWQGGGIRNVGNPGAYHNGYATGISLTQAGADSIK